MRPLSWRSYRRWSEAAFRTIALVRMRISEKMERYGRGGTKLNRMQVKRTGNSKKIRWTDGNKSNSPYLRGKFLVVGANLVLWSNKTMKLKLRRETTRTRIHFVHRTGTGRGPWPCHGHWHRWFFFLEPATFTPTWMTSMYMNTLKHLNYLPLN